MNERPVAAVLALLPFAYVAAVVLPSFPAQDLGVGFAFVMSVVIGILSAMPSPRAQEIGAWVGIGLAIIIGVTFSEIQMFGDLGAQLAAGVLLGMPWIAVAYVWRPGEQVRNGSSRSAWGSCSGSCSSRRPRPCRPRRAGSRPPGTSKRSTSSTSRRSKASSGS